MRRAMTIRSPLRRAGAVLLCGAAALSLAACSSGGDGDTGEADAEIVADSSLPPLQPEMVQKVTTSGVMLDDWVFVTDASFDRPTDGRAVLVDLASKRMLGMLSGGYNQQPLMIAPDGKSLLQLSTYYARGTRGERTDVVTKYEMSDLLPGRETIVPPKTIRVIPMLATAQLTDDGQFAVLSNFTPAQSITVMNAQSGELVGEFASPGCGLVYPIGERRFMVHCSDGGLKIATMSDSGEVTFGKVSVPISPMTDPVSEKPVRISKTSWAFVSHLGAIIEVDASGDVPVVKRSRPLVSEADSAWRPGGIQPAAFDRATNRIYVLMHEGGEWTHKDPGTHVWVYDMTKGEIVQKLDLGQMATSIALTPGPNPRLLTIMFGASDALSIYDLASGSQTGSIDQLGQTLTTIQTRPVAW